MNFIKCYDVFLFASILITEHTMYRKTLFRSLKDQIRIRILSPNLIIYPPVSESQARASVTTFSPFTLNQDPDPQHWYIRSCTCVGVPGEADEVPGSVVGRDVGDHLFPLHAQHEPVVVSHCQLKHKVDIGNYLFISQKKIKKNLSYYFKPSKIFQIFFNIYYRKMRALGPQQTVYQAGR